MVQQTLQANGTKAAWIGVSMNLGLETKTVKFKRWRTRKWLVRLENVIRIEKNQDNIVQQYLTIVGLNHSHRAAI